MRYLRNIDVPKKSNDVSEEDVLTDMAIKEAKEVEEKIISNINSLETKSTSIYTFLVGGTGVFTAITAIVSILDFSGLGAVDPLFYQYVIQDAFIRISAIFFLTSIGFAFLGSSSFITAQGIGPTHINDAINNKSKYEWKKDMLRNLKGNIEHNVRVSIRKKCLVSTSFLALIFSMMAAVIGISNLVLLLEASPENGTIVYRITESDPIRSQNIIYLFIAYLFILIIAVEPLILRAYAVLEDQEVSQEKPSLVESMQDVLKHYMYWPFGFLLTEVLVLGYLSISNQMLIERPQDIIVGLAVVLLASCTVLVIFHQVVHRVRILFTANR
jgi:hypothetical protein